MKTRNLVTLILVGFVIFIIVTWLNQSRINTQLEKAKATTAAAEIKLKQAQQETRVIQDRLNRITYKADTAIAAADDRIEALYQQQTMAQVTIDSLTSERNTLLDSLEEFTLGNGPEAEPAPEKIMEEAIALYPDQDVTSLDLADNRPAQNLFFLMVKEIQARRKLELSHELLIKEYQAQQDRLETIIRNHEDRYLSLQNKSSEQERFILVLTEENRQYQELANNLHNEIGIYENKAAKGWICKLAIISALAGGFYLGMSK